MLACANTPASYANQVLGELWISYTVKLRKPKFFTARGLGISRDYYVSGGILAFNNWMGTSFLSGQQNNIGTKIVYSGTYGAYTASSAQPILVFPASYAGTIEIAVFIEASALVGGGFTYNLNGNVIPVNDQYAAVNSSPTTSPLASLSSMGLNTFFILHVRISPATNGVDNVVQLLPIITSATIVQSSINVTEYNGGFSYRETNQGNSDAPVLINSSGVITQP